MFSWVNDTVVSHEGLFSVKMVADSVNTYGNRLATFELMYPRVIHGELNTHRVFSRNAMSSRAIPVAKFIEQVLTGPYVPQFWGVNQPGMQASVLASPEIAKEAVQVWLEASVAAVHYAKKLMALNIHKQNVNRLLEPFQWMRTIVTATEWSNFFALRNHEKAEPHFRLLAQMMAEVMSKSDPVTRYLDSGDYRDLFHLPYVRDTERIGHELPVLLRMSSARCARGSYLNHDSTKPTIEDDTRLYLLLTSDVPPHASPLEHQATPIFARDDFTGNFVGWRQHRHNLHWSRDKAEPCAQS